MEYKLQKIKKKKEISLCAQCPISSYNWGGDYRPLSFAQMGILSDSELYIHMWSKEQDPSTTYTENQQPVYLDSALEFFIKFSQDAYYYNFEVNSAGAMLAQRGASKSQRTPLADRELEKIGCIPSKFSDEWHIYLTIPINHFTGNAARDFSFNFYKIKESPGNTHFASYAPIDSKTPDFHRPEFFAKAVWPL